METNPEIIDCPNCPNIGHYMVRVHRWDGKEDFDYEQCQFCYEQPNSRFNYQRRLEGEENTS